MDHQARKYELLLSKFQKAGQKIVNHQSGYLGLDVGEGRVPRVGVPDEFHQGDAGDIAQALAYVQRLAEQYPDDFARWAAISDILNKVDSGSSPRKASINRSGQTHDPQVYRANAIGSTPGAGKTVLTSELDRLVASAKELLFQANMHEGHLNAKILHVSKL